MALAQSGKVAQRITERTGRPVEIVGITSFGDVSQEQLTQIGGTGVFVSVLRESLRCSGLTVSYLARGRPGNWTFRRVAR
jgi:porphobilinogen deaminase